MKKTLSLFIASIFLVNSVALAADYPCKAEYESELAQLKDDFEATLARSFKRKGKKIGGAMRNSHDIYSLCSGDCNTDLGNGDNIAIGVLASIGEGASTGGLAGGMAGALSTPGPESVTKGNHTGPDHEAHGKEEWSRAKSGGLIGTVIATVLFAYGNLIDGNLDFKETTHAKSTSRFNKYIQLQAANDVLKEIYSSRDSIIADYRQRTVDVKAINDKNDKRLAKVNKRRAAENLPPLTMEAAFLDFKIEETEDSELSTALDGVVEKLKWKIGEVFSKEELVQIIRQLNDEKAFCEDGDPVRYKKMYKIIKGRIN